MSSSVPPRGSRGAARIAVVATPLVALLLLLTNFEIGPTSTHWLGSLAAMAAALVVVALAEVSWQRAIKAAESAGLVATNPGDHLATESPSPRRYA